MERPMSFCWPVAIIGTNPLVPLRRNTINSTLSKYSTSRVVPGMPTRAAWQPGEAVCESFSMLINRVVTGTVVPANRLPPEAIYQCCNGQDDKIVHGMSKRAWPLQERVIARFWNGRMLMDANWIVVLVRMRHWEINWRPCNGCDGMAAIGMFVRVFLHHIMVICLYYNGPASMGVPGIM